MIVSMTGFGSASADRDGITCSVEIRAVNNRFFKAIIKLPDKLGSLEAEVDRLLRDAFTRGSIVLAVSIKDERLNACVKINRELLQTYVQQAKDTYHALATGENKIPEPRVDVASLMALPGVLEPGDDAQEYLETHRDLVLSVISQSIKKLDEMRQREGAALYQDLTKHLAVIRSALDKITLQAPMVARAYHEKLRNRVVQMVSDAKLSLSDTDLLKEVALFADRSDISEEIARLSGHLDQFQTACQKEEDAGRKLDFISQEMLREANTIASKANDADISKLTVDVKSAIDRIKEQVQNVE